MPPAPARILVSSRKAQRRYRTFLARPVGLLAVRQLARESLLGLRREPARSLRDDLLHTVCVLHPRWLQFLPTHRSETVGPPLPDLRFLARKRQCHRRRILRARPPARANHSDGRRFSPDPAAVRCLRHSGTSDDPSHRARFAKTSI